MSDLTQALKEIEEYAKATNDYAILNQPTKIIVRPADFPGKSDSEIREVVDRIMSRYADSLRDLSKS